MKTSSGTFAASYYGTNIPFQGGSSAGILYILYVLHRGPTKKVYLKLDKGYTVVLYGCLGLRCGPDLNFL